MSDLSALRTALAGKKQEAVQAYLSDRRPTAFFRAYTAALEETLSVLWQQYFSGSRLCLLATGGFGRTEVYPHSDVDLALIAPDRLSEAEQVCIEQLVQSLWDIGLTPALKSGSLKDLCDSAKHDLTADTAFLEARFLYGDCALAQQALSAFKQQRDTVGFIERKLLEMQQRHTKQPALVLEPDIKNGMGGLRDIHTMMWLAQVQDLTPDFYSLMHQKILTRTEAGLLRGSHRRLACMRIELHLAANRDENRLLFDFQGILSEHIQAESKQAGIEKLMHRFYRTVKTVMQLNGILIPMLRQRVWSRLPYSIHPINERYFQSGNKIAATDLDLFDKHPESLFEIISVWQSRPDLNGIAPKTLRRWWAAARKADAATFRLPENRAFFLGFFQNGRGLTHILRFLNLYGVLERYLPRWGNIVGLLQHDLFHVYPVDDHILTVIGNLRRFAMEEHSHEIPFASTLMAEFERPHILYLAALFHDIAKGRHGDHAKLGVHDASEFAQTHSLSEEDGRLLAWLVKEHLLMSATAQKEDIQNPDVVAEFCKKVPDYRSLSALYLLTVADIRGTNPKIWNSWKAQLLHTLFQAASSHFIGRHDTPIPESRRDSAKHFLLRQGYSEKNIHKLFQALGEAYFARYTEAASDWQLSQLIDNPRQPACAIRPLHDHTTLQILVYMPNGERLFTRLCRLFSRHHADIAAARAFITAHDYILDNFIIRLPENSTRQDAARIQAAIEKELSQFIQGNIPKHTNSTAKPSRRARILPFTPHVHISNDEGHRHTIEIITADRSYLLADITEIFSRHQISLHHAKIFTLGDRVEDVFSVYAPSLNEPAAILALKQDLLEI